MPRTSTATETEVVSEEKKLENTKECKRCHEVKPKTTEHFNKSSKGYFNSYCRECNKQVNKDHYAQHKQLRGRQPYKLTEEFKERYAEGLTVRELAEEFNLGEATIRKWRRNGLLTPVTSSTEEEEE